MTAVELPVPGSAATTRRAARRRIPTASSIEEIFRHLGPVVLGYLRTGGAGDAEDLLGDVFLRVARGLARFQGDGDDLRRWVFTIAHHCLIDDHRRRTRERHFLRRASRVQAAARPAAEPFDPALLDALARLTTEQREVVTLRFVADLSLEEVARITDRTSGAVKSLQHRALRTLAVLLTPPSAAGGPTGAPSKLE